MQYLEDVVPRILGKHTKFVTLFVSTIDEIPAIFFKLGASCTKLAHAYYVFCFETCNEVTVALR